MGIGSGIALIAIGAILAFALPDAAGPINLYMIGLILMAAGAAVAVISFIMGASRRTSRTVTQEGPAGTTVTREDRRDPGTY